MFRYVCGEMCSGRLQPENNQLSTLMIDDGVLMWNIIDEPTHCKWDWRFQGKYNTFSLLCVRPYDAKQKVRVIGGSLKSGNGNCSRNLRSIKGNFNCFQIALFCCGWGSQFCFSFHFFSVRPWARAILLICLILMLWWDVVCVWEAFEIWHAKFYIDWKIMKLSVYFIFFVVFVSGFFEN